MIGVGEQQCRAQVRLRIAQTTDLHGHVCAFDYTADRHDPTLGLARLARVIETARREAPQMLLLDNGDALFGNPMADLWAEGAGPQGAHPMIAAMNLLAYDAAALGNHEFNFGFDPLTRALAQARFPVLAANVLRLPGVSAPWQASTLLYRDLTDDSGKLQRLCIGVVAVMPPQVMQWDARHLAGRVTACGMVARLRALVPALRAEGADIVIVLNHSGIGCGSDDPARENTGLAIARLPGVDAVICGHQHRLFPGPGHPAQPEVDAAAGRLAGKPAVMAGSRGSHLGLIDLDLEPGAGTGWQVVAARVALRPVAGQAPVAAMRDLVAPAHTATRNAMAEVAGYLPCALNSHWDQLGNPGITAFVAAAQRWHAARLLRDQPEGALPLLSAAAPFRCGGAGGPGHYLDLLAGPLHQRDLHAIYGFPNDLRVVRACGADLVRWLEHAAAQFNQIAPQERQQHLIAPDFAPYNFDTLFGLSYRFDLSRPALFRRDGSASGAAGAGRLRDLCWQGRPVAPDQVFAVATNSYRAEGGGGFTPLPAIAAPGLEQPLRRVVAEFVAAGLPGGATLPADWGFAAMPGTSVLLQTAPGAIPPPGLCATALGLDSEGFLQVDIRL